MEIIRKFSNVKSLNGVRSISKLWKSLIDNSQFINGCDDHIFALSYSEGCKSSYASLDDMVMMKIPFTRAGRGYRNDWRKLLVYYGRDVEAGRCVRYDSMEKKKKTKLGENERSRSKIDECTSKSPKTPVKAITSGEGCSESPNLANSNKKNDRKKPVCGFRLYASWMSTEHSFQIKSLKPEHNCSKNYNLGSLVTYRWIAHHYAKQLIADPFIPTLKMKTNIRDNFLINVSLGQRPRKNRMKAQSENNSQVSRLGRKMICTNCQKTRHNKSNSKKEPVPKPPKVPRPPALKIVYGTHASAIVRGRGSRGGRGAFGGRLKVVKIGVKAVQLGRHKEEGEGEGVREEEVVVREEEVGEKEAGEGVREAEFVVHLFQEEMTEDEECEYYRCQCANSRISCSKMSNRGEIGFRLGDYEAEELGKRLAGPIVAVTPSAKPIASAAHSIDKGKEVAEPRGKKKGSKRKAPASSEEAVGNQRIIFYKNKGRSERIFNQKMKKYGLDQMGKGQHQTKLFH
nr:calcium/proton exchanger [Tanacetum cinerariifolium]GEV16651.1 calcium/proton exchanger [Tanacetum cinerariifolium]